jgi:hypothetical protein
MSKQGLDREVTQQINVLQIFGIAFVASLLIYAGLAWALVEVIGLEATVDLDATVTAVIAVVALGMIPAAEVSSRTLRNRASPAHQALTPQEALQAYSQATIVGFALREACGVIGLTLSILTADWLWAVLLSFVALVAMLAAWPRPHSVQEWLLQHPGVRRD